MDRTRLALISIGQAANNICDTVACMDKRFIPFFVNTTIKDVEVLKHANKLNTFIFANTKGAGANRDTGKEITQPQLPNLIDTIENSFVMQDTLYLITSSAGGSGSSITPRLIQLIKRFMPDKIINLIAIVPSIEESKRRRSNCIEFWNDILKVKDYINSIMFIDNNAIPCDNNDYDKINKEFAKLFNYSFAMCDSNTKGNIDEQDSETIHNAKGITAIYSLPSSKNNFEDVNEAIEYSIKNSIFANSIGFKTVSHLGISLKDNSNYTFNDIENYFTITDDKFKGYNALDKDLVMLSGLPFNSVMETIELIQTSLKEDEIEHSIKNIADDISNLMINTNTPSKSTNKSQKSFKKKEYTVDDVWNNDDAWDDLV